MIDVEVGIDADVAVKVYPVRFCSLFLESVSCRV